VGDARFAEKCERALLSRRERGSIVMVSHSNETIRRYCDRGAVLHDGQLTHYDDIDEAYGVYNAILHTQ
jgi:capsular polysaccharide transport system ATP-binding protein